MCGIYIITNTINNKSYIGQSTNIKLRWKSHRNYSKEISKYPLYRAFNKYGIDNFEFEVLELCHKSVLNTREDYYIQLFNTMLPNGYNQREVDLGYYKNTPDVLEEIIQRLRETTESSEDIGKIFNITGRTVRLINSGSIWYRDNMEYPIRKNLPHTRNDYKGREKGTKTCEICEKLTKNKRFCSQKCSQYAQRKVIRPKKEDLLRELRDKSFDTVGKIYHVSGNTIRKWIK